MEFQDILVILGLFMLNIAFWAWGAYQIGKDVGRLECQGQEAETDA